MLWVCYQGRNEHFDVSTVDDFVAIPIRVDLARCGFGAQDRLDKRIQLRNVDLANIGNLVVIQSVVTGGVDSFSQSVILFELVFAKTASRSMSQFNSMPQTEAGLSPVPKTPSASNTNAPLFTIRTAAS